ncbi:hypothetical protein PCG10_008681 [Penicillium crustosum]|uniref:SMP-30/Gluconolactonase/LRE-like region domain-containing protein n=1 Tax=Penicillium crustosum TaxID=36656 RepID=A0A9P5KY95_PENCR|nr:uncharacterized protein N7487_006364 [Penicillium crustosum]KAF7520938.1 hypothetical protein PCG10_008681 [Penicillium crustosum]KAJ5412005.1 hypothetical protein N7487_006364 [Penicillium crustosum]
MSNNTISFTTHDQRFVAIVGSSPTAELLAENKDYSFAHEAGVFFPDTNKLFVTSNRCIGPNGQQKVHITRVDLSTTPITCQEISTEIPMGNGGINYDKDDVLFCAQGTMTEPSGLYRMSTIAPYKSELLKADFHGRPFNSVNDVVVHTDGSIWFTDPIYGSEQGYRPPPRLPNQVYRWCPDTGAIRAVADGFGRPNGICFSPDEQVVYITDTDRVHGDGSIDDQRVSSIYAFDVCTIHGEPFLTNRRLFAMADQGIPDGIKCDLEGNVYSGCGDGINVWSPGGVLLGRIRVDGGVSNFCFGRNGEIFALNEHRLWRVQLGAGVKGALLRL